MLHTSKRTHRQCGGRQTREEENTPMNATTTRTNDLLTRIARTLLVPAAALVLLAGVTGTASANPLEACGPNSKHCGQQQQQQQQQGSGFGAQQQQQQQQ